MDLQIEDDSKNKSVTQIRYQKDVDYSFKLDYQRITTEATLKLQMDFKRRDKDKGFLENVLRYGMKMHLVIF